MFSLLFSYLRTNHEVNGIVIIILSLLSITAVGLFLYIIFETIKGKAYKFYKEDQFHNVNWRWRWGKSGIKDLWCYCPTCDASLVYDDTSTGKYSSDRNPRTEFICENCGITVGVVKEHNNEYVLGMVEREIWRRIRNNLHRKDNSAY